MKFIHTADGAAPTQAEITFLEQAAYKLAAGMQAGTTRRSFETVGTTSAYLVAGAPGVVNIHTVKDSTNLSLGEILATLPNSYGPSYTPPDFVAGFIQSGGRYKMKADGETGCSIPEQVADVTVHTEYVSQDYANRKLTAMGGKLYAATECPPFDTDTVTYSQASRKRPGYFTGHMAAVVQLLLGAGRFMSPSVYKQAAKKGPGNPLAGMPLGVDAQTGKMDEPPNAGAFRYMKPFKEDECRGTMVMEHPFAMEVPWDYRWHRTHGIMFGKDNTGGKAYPLAFIIDVNNLGVYAYPVKVDPLTRYTRTQRYMKRVYPWLAEPVFNGVSVFDAFGGIPLPTYFNKAQLDPAVAAGKAVRLCDTNNFYSGEFMSTMFGWAFSETTNEAANITVKWEGADGMKSAHLFKLKVMGLQLATETDGGKKRTVVKGTATFTDTRKGNVFNPGRPPYFDPCRATPAPQFHIYEPVLGKMISYDFYYNRRGTGKEKCDAPIFCCYIKDDLHILNYVYDAKQAKPDVDESTREPCQVVGTWARTTKIQTFRAGVFYNSTMDLRKEVSAGGTGKIVTKEWPAYNYTLHSQADFFSQLCVSERKYFNHHRQEVVSNKGEGWAANICTSSTDRSVYFACTLDTKINGTKGRTEGISFAGTGAEVRYTAFYYFITHWAGGISPAKSSGCMEPLDDVVVVHEDSCFPGPTESLVGKVKHYSLRADGTEWCGYMAGSQTGGFYSAEGMLGNWTAVGGYEVGRHPIDRYPEPQLRYSETTGEHEATAKIYIFGAPLANGRMIMEYKATAPATEEPFGYEFVSDWFRFSMPQCPVTTMPVCRNFYGKDFMSCYNDHSWDETREFGTSRGLGPTAIPVGGIMK